MIEETIMSVFTKICTGLFVSVLSLSAQAAQPETETQTPGQQPAETTVDVSNATEVIQVLHIGVSSESKIVDLIRERNPDEALQQFVEQLSQDITMLSSKLQELAASKSVSLSPEALTENAKAIETQMTAEVQALTQASDEEFRTAAIQTLISKYEKALELYNQVEQESTDAELKAAATELRPMTQKHLADAQQLQAEPTEPGVE